MKAIIGPLICKTCGGRVLYGDSPVIHRDGWKRPHVVFRRGFYNVGGERHRCGG